MYFKEDFESARKRLDAFWHGDMIDRCVMAVCAPRKEPLPFDITTIESPVNLWDRWTNPEKMQKIKREGEVGERKLAVKLARSLKTIKKAQTTSEPTSVKKVKKPQEDPRIRGAIKVKRQKKEVKEARAKLEKRAALLHELTFKENE